ncbi:MAG: glycosyltransferase family 39 protein, partial [Deltaproteobacteria bacterium]|nr:glycosyltransferase family 39 protein [Deltaproteobacteria bacterium]
MTNRWKLLLLFFGVNFLLRISTLFHPIGNIDEPQTAQVAWEWMLGNPPYTTSFGDKPFFYYLFFYLILSVFGKFNLIAVHVGTTIVVALTAWAIHFLAKQAWDEKRGLVCALLFSAVTTMGDFRLIASDGESLMNFPMVLAMLVFFSAVQTRKLSLFFGTGLLIGLASQFRYQGGIQLAVVGSFLLIYEPFFTAPKGERFQIFRRGVVETALVTFAFLIPFA